MVNICDSFGCNSFNMLKYFIDRMKYSKKKKCNENDRLWLGSVCSENEFTQVIYNFFFCQELYGTFEHLLTVCCVVYLFNYPINISIRYRISVFSAYGTVANQMLIEIQVKFSVEN